MCFRQSHEFDIFESSVTLRTAIKITRERQTEGLIIIKELYLHVLTKMEKMEGGKKKKSK